MELTAENVIDIFEKCLFTDGEDTSHAVIAQGIVQTIGFHPGRLKENRLKICELVNQLPLSFRKSKGGDSFASMCRDKTGEQWADLDRIIEQLLTLGIAIRAIKYTLPRELTKGNIPEIYIVEEFFLMGKEEYVGKIPERTELPVQSKKEKGK